MKIPQIKPDWETGIYIGNGVVAKPVDCVLYQVIKKYQNHWLIAADGKLMDGPDGPGRYFTTKKAAVAFVKKYYNKNFN